MKVVMRVFLFLAVLGSASAASPIEKVIELLKNLQVKVEKQGANEAIQYDKYACFCKNQARIKQEAMDKSGEQIEVLTAEIKDLAGNIKSLNGDIVDLGKDIKQLKADIATGTSKREKAHEEYLVKAKDLSEAIGACGEAIDALKGSKAAMSAGADVDLAQLKSAAFNAKLAQSPATMTTALSLVKMAKRAAQNKPGEANAFKYQSNEIIATIEELQTTFKGNKKDLDFDEMEARDRSERQILGWSNEKTFKNKEKKEKEALVEQKTEEKSEAEQTKDEENTNKDSDESFLKTLTGSCEQKAKDWDQRSSARADEMAALAQATEVLENGALKQYNVNKKLVGLVAAKALNDAMSKVPAPVVVVKQEAPKKPSFLQLRSVGSTQAAAVQRLLANLDAAATRLNSPVLTAIAIKVQLKEDHFSNVRALIKDLISKLEGDAKAEATTKGFCDTEMKKAVDNRDKAALEIEEQNGIISKKNSLARAKAAEIEDLSTAIAELNKSILEAEELRKGEKADNTASVAEAKAGTEAVKSALVVLKGFYGFVQYKPPKSDRFGETVDDVAPESFSGEYKGLGDSAKGIVGTLEVIQSDFERTVTQTEKEEKDAATEHTAFLKKANADIKTKTQDKKDAQKAKEGAEEAVVQGKDDLYDGEKLHDSSLEELEKLSPMCVDGTETYAERVDKRKEEIEALKNAFQILDDWQK